MEGMNNQKEELEPGYSVKRIKRWFDPSLRMNPRPLARNHSEIPHASSEEDLAAKKESEIKLETAAISSLFISKVWPSVKQAIVDKFSRLPDPQKIFGGKTSEQVAGIIDLYLSGPADETVHEWVTNLEKEFESESLDENKTRLKQAYERYKKVLSLGKSKVVNREGKPVQKVDGHIIGGLVTSRMMITNTLGVLPSVFMDRMGRSPTKEELLSLIEGAKPLLFAIAATHVRALGPAQDELWKRTDGGGSSLAIPEFDPSKFLILKKNNKLYLELDPEVLVKMEHALLVKTFGKTADELLFTGCPALMAQGEKGTNVVDEMYDTVADLYKKFYIGTHYKEK